MPTKKSQQTPPACSIIYDGDCPMCSTIMRKVEKTSPTKATKYIDFRSQKPPVKLAKEAMEKEIHVVDEAGRVYKNAEAILVILRSYPRWRFLAAVGAIQPFKFLLTLGYRYIAANRFFIFGKLHQIYWLKIITGVAFIAGLLLSPKLWQTERAFPQIPVLNFLPAIPQPVAVLMFAGLLVLAAMMVLSARPRRYIISLCALLAVSILFDQSRFQPWVYQYGVICALLSFYNWNLTEERLPQSILNSTRFVIAAIYFWSGLSKMNLNFINYIFPWFMNPFLRFIPENLHNLVFATGVFVSITEMVIGVGLLTKRFRKPAVILAILMHLFILFVLSPLGNNWNSVVWPWNIAMIGYVVLLFGPKTTPSFKAVVFGSKKIFHWLIVLLFGIMPFFSLVNWWDPYMSFALYSGNTATAAIFYREKEEKVVAEVAQYAVKLEEKNEYFVDINAWSYRELNVPAYPDARVFKKVITTFCQSNPTVDVLAIIQHKAPVYKLQGKQEFLNCQDVQ